ncbi:dienelactone hydrolase-like enzyme [Terriglobus roseus DSM 18391]|uniref:Dienelactone hydrolase-like enzyme n=1 Tax=Terriglobus roseus (strain DSM 18391 / NRRL B-41598 / KBS 63) TaxID=926566 RepID=I3ZLM0_TERRK|nr:dienelactone hydrolase family protein [Terriglobus roseus]AFL90138.1 dienelactone hydrolase-like enzyme [Terriglobus roseus DSM 18391]
MSITQGDGGTGEEFQPASGKPGTWPSVLLVPGRGGLTDSIRSAASALAAQGYKVLALDPTDGTAPTKLVGKPVWTEGPHDKNVERIEYALVYLEAWMMDPSKIAVIGWDEGATLSADVAVAEENVKVLVTNDGQLPIDPASVARLKAAVLGNFSALGQVDRDGINTFATAMKRARKTTDLKVYVNARAGFEEQDSESYRPGDAADAEQRTLLFLTKYLPVAGLSRSRTSH